MRVNRSQEFVIGGYTPIPKNFDAPVLGYCEGDRLIYVARTRNGFVAIHQRENAFRDKYERYLSATPFDADRKRKALTAVAAKMARVAYAVVKHGSDYQCFFEHRLPSGSIPLARAVEAISTS